MRTAFDFKEVAHDVERCDAAIDSRMLCHEIEPNNAVGSQRLSNLDELARVSVGDTPRAASPWLRRHPYRSGKGAASGEGGSTLTSMRRL